MICGDHLVESLRVVKSWKLRWFGDVAKMEETKNSCRILFGKAMGKFSLGSLSNMLEKNIRR